VNQQEYKTRLFDMAFSKPAKPDVTEYTVIEELVKRYYTACTSGPLYVDEAIRAALTELQRTHNLELIARDGTISELEGKIQKLESTVKATTK